jgi:hypothetical protein
MSATISATWDVEHDEIGQHRDVNLSSLTCNSSEEPVIGVYSGFRFLVGPWLLNEPADPRSTSQAVIFQENMINVDNWNPPGLANAIGIIMDSAFNIQITGIYSERQCRMMFLCNRGGTIISLVHNSASSQSEYRFRCPSSATYQLAQGGGCWIVYNPAAKEWLVLGKN